METKTINIEEVGKTTIQGLYSKGVDIIIVKDPEYNNEYTIAIRRSNLGLGVNCWLDDRPSFQAERAVCPNPERVSNIINRIAGMKVINEKGEVINYE